MDPPAAPPLPPLSRANKKKSSERQLPVPGNIAAIDFGTTALTLSYSTSGSSEVKTLKFDYNVDSRVPNAILLEHKGSKVLVLALGKMAKNIFTSARAGDRKNYIYFERIKMLLKRDKGIDREAHVTSFTGEVFYLIEVIAFILKHMAKELHTHLNHTATPIAKDKFDWVITVPAIWDVKGKRLMREAAFLSGMLTNEEGITTLTPVGCGISRPMEINPEKLSLALEPECAAIYSQIESKSEIAQHSATVSKAEAKDFAAVLGKGYMVIDAGGGTVDITVQKEASGGVEVVTVPDGNPMGGTKINEEFSLKFQEIVGDIGFAKFLRGKDETDAIAKKVVCDQFLYHEFELQKVTLCDDNNDKLKEICISIPRQFLAFYGEDTISEGVESMEGYEFENDSIYISKAAAEETLLNPCICELTDCVMKILKDCSPVGTITTIYLVGGFGSCKFVRKKVKKALEENSMHINVIIPRSPLLAIATGAVMWRRNPEVIKSRRSDATYGIATQQLFDKKKHRSAYKVRNESEGKDYCKDILDVFLLKGEKVDLDDVFVSSLRVPSDDAEVVCLTIYSTKNDDVQYIKSPDGDLQLQPIGQIFVETPNPDKFPLRKRRIEVTISFSGTEITAKAKYEPTGKEVETVCDFLSAISHV